MAGHSMYAAVDDAPFAVPSGVTLHYVVTVTSTAQAIAERLAAARRRNLWHPLRNSVDEDLAALIAEASATLPARQAAE